MFRSYFKIMIRNMIKRKYYSGITIFGLTVAIAFALLAGIFIRQELLVNKNIKDVDRLYLLVNTFKNGDDNFPFFVPAALARQAVETYPNHFESYYRFRDRSITVSKGEKHFRIQSMIGDSTFFSMFGFPVLFGQSSSALNDPNTIVITAKIAKQFFNTTDVVGESLKITTETNGLKEFLITAVIEDLQQKNSVSDFMNMDAQVFLSLENKDDFALGYQDDWRTDIISYIKLASGVLPADATNILNRIVASAAPKDIHAQRTMVLNPLKDYYVVTNHGAVQKLITALTAIVIFILLLAIANFINISIAGSFSRLKEVGVRKVIGGVKRQVVFQFLLESVVYAIISCVLALFLYQVLHRYVGEILDVTLPSALGLDFSFWMWLVSGVLLVGILAGSYPSLYLSATATIESLKGKFKSVKGTIRFSRGLIALQFFIAIFIFTASLIMSKQIAYFMEADLGYDKSFVLIVSSVPRIWTEEGMNKMEAAKQEFLSSPEIASASLSWGSPNWTFSPANAKLNLLGKPIDEGVQVTISPVDEDYASVYRLNVLAGKFFFDEAESFQSDRLVINESAQKAMKVQVGDKVQIQFSDKVFTISGIVKDFHFESLHSPIKPVVFTHNRDFGAFRYFSFKLKSGNMAESVAAVEKRWKKIFPNEPFEYGFTDDRLATLYKTELQLKKASGIASVLILVIVLTGVLGLVSLSVAKRNKEIGIRKVLGATASNILLLVSREYIVVMAFSFLIGLPLTYLFIYRWLTSFAYHIDLKWWMFAFPVLSLFVITLLVVGMQSLKTAMSDPVKSLKYE